MKKIPAVNVILKFAVGNVVIFVTGVHVQIVWIPLHHRLLSRRQVNHDNASKCRKRSEKKKGMDFEILR